MRGDGQDVLGVLLAADDEVGQPRVGVAVAKRFPVEPAGVQSAGQGHRDRGARVPLVLAAGVDVHLGRAEDDGGDLGAGRSHGTMTPPMASVTS